MIAVPTIMPTGTGDGMHHGETDDSGWGADRRRRLAELAVKLEATTASYVEREKAEASREISPFVRGWQAPILEAQRAIRAVGSGLNAQSARA